MITGGALLAIFIYSQRKKSYIRRFVGEGKVYASFLKPFEYHPKFCSARSRYEISRESRRQTSLCLRWKCSIMNPVLSRLVPGIWCYNCANHVKDAWIQHLKRILLVVCRMVPEIVISKRTRRGVDIFVCF